jgi:multicomponent Na+:H+ antiporter subunit G
VTVDLVRDYVGGVLVVIGAVFVLISAIGLVRMPDLFTRIHAASVGDTLGFGLVTIGLVVTAGFSLVAVKLIFLVLFVYFSGPVMTHAIARAALHAGIAPKLADGAEVPAPPTGKA